MRRIFIAIFLFSLNVAATTAPNSPYVAAMRQGPFLAKCFPDTFHGNQGVTQILRIRREGDEVLTSFAWYNRHGLAMGWSPATGKVAVMRLEQDEALPAEKQIEIGFYLGDQFLKSYTTADLVKLGAKTETDADAEEAGLGIWKRAIYTVEGTRQVWNTNDYYFVVKLSETKSLFFDIVTGKLCQIEKDGDRKERLVFIEK